MSSATVPSLLVWSLKSRISEDSFCIWISVFICS